MMNNDLSTDNRNYDSVASHYQLLSSIYSFGKILESKASQIKYIQPNHKVLYIGGGTGEDAILAAKKGAIVTCIDLSENMINKSKEIFAKNNIEATFICNDVMKHNLYNHYDLITANYFLNIFPKPVMMEVLKHIIKLVKSGGKILIADFAPPKGNIISKSTQYIYHAIANLSYAIQGLAPVHSVYNYPLYLEELDIIVKDINYFNLTKFGPTSYLSITAEKI